MLAIGTNSTAIMAALPDMRTELHLGPGGVEWAVNAYLVVSAAFIVLGGAAADRFGVRPASMAGLVLFAIASCIIAVATTEVELLAGRAMQGLAAAFAVPSTLAAVDASSPPERRTASIGAWSGFLMLGFSIGPLFGGALTHFVGWRAIFWLNIPLMLIAIVGLATAGAMTTPAHEKQTPADGLDRLCLARNPDGVGRLRLARIAAGAHGAATGVGPFALAMIALVLLLIVEFRSSHRWSI